jgi:hypothetical protein
MKICPMGDELFHADGGTNITKLTVAFRSFTNSPKEGHNTEFVPPTASYNDVQLISIGVQPMAFVHVE